ncbi:cellulose biosynthesis cyclic di-GMP-binding regulatory protein BcsB [Kineothrix sp. MB12-C1]|uniref:cellulose biosynthesis cyclic di-GMP-binding regulatory protein BcsB n=1 Tax=Kineothrix sp. MB12-C1 TaxID=3070215 RepID=UPI0027D24470|nr:cellulose biosynthesis cyclic di-GMP-binding regulatory protein BcsB [Kineothrix sp. MB12-C1]WMC93724.1 cellulose biosynthesis cyclic di-GMP-binding regulatory protein BcsB [Kineothrix sp. MB12-C1]
MISKKIICSFALIAAMSLLITGNVSAEEQMQLHEENFSADHDLKGLFASCEEYFQVGDWEVEDAKATIIYTATTLVRQEVSDFTVSLNSEPIYSQKIPLTAGETQELTITLPKRLLTEGANSIRMESYIRTNENDPCEDDISTASWMVVREDSHVSVSYKPTVVCRNVADVYRQMTSIEGLENEKSAVFLPQGPTENELTSAAYLLSGISLNAILDYEKMALVEIEELKDMSAYRYGAYVCEYGRLPGNIKSLLSEEQKAAAEKGSIIAFVETQGGTDLLVVTGKDTTSMQNACRLFGNKSNMEQTKAVWRKVAAEEDVNVLQLPEVHYLLTQTGSYVSGPFIQTAFFTVPMNANKSIAAGSETEIHFRYAQNLDFDRSLVTVYIDDIPIGSKKLEKSSANGDVLKVSIPDDLQVTGNFALRVTFDLEMKDLMCDIRRQEMPWAYVTNESTVSLKTEEVPWLLFDYYPGPFIYEGRLNQVVIILPVEEGKEELDAMRKILLTLGRYQTDNSGTIRVCRADNMGDLSASNIISIGCLSDNPIVQQINNQLYFQFSPEGTTLRSNEKMKIEANYGASLGTAQLLYSPYSANKYALLAVSGVTKEGMAKAADYLGSVEKNWQIFGDGYVTDGELIACHRFGPDNGKQYSLLFEMTRQSSIAALLIIGGSVLLLMTLSLIMIWIKHRRDE